MLQDGNDTGASIIAFKLYEKPGSEPAPTFFIFPELRLALDVTKRDGLVLLFDARCPPYAPLR